MYRSTKIADRLVTFKDASSSVGRSHNTMIEEISHFLDTVLAVIIGIFGWIFKKFADRLDKDEDRLTKIEIDLSAQNERDNAVETRMSGLEEKIKEMSNDLPPLKEFILPGGSEFNSRLHIARTTCRNSERSLVAMYQKQERNDLHAKYLNRLSDYLFLLARVVRLKKNQEEEHWELNK